MQLFVNRPSPYGRKAIVAALESGLAVRIDFVQVDPWCTTALRRFGRTSRDGLCPCSLENCACRSMPGSPVTLPRVT